MKIKKYLLSKNIQPHTKGFEYLALAIELCQKQNSVKNLHKGIYKEIADSNNDMVYNVERAIRYSISNSHDPVTNSVFIARALLELEEN